MIIENYKIISQIDEGAFGIVYKAQDLNTKDIVAIKKIKKSYTSWEECLRLKEVLSLSKLKHPHIIRLISALKQNTCLYLVFEYCNTNLLKYYLQRKQSGQRFLEQEIKKIIYQMTLCLAHMHSNGFFHRDLKPENILLNDEFDVKLADFGLAREIRSQPPFTDYVATRWYWAPEILLKSPSYNSPVDIFALGCIMAELYLLDPLFNGNSEIDQLNKIFKIMGTPSSDWQNAHKVVSQIHVKFPSYQKQSLQCLIHNASPQAIQLMERMLKVEHTQRATANDILKDPFFNDIWQKDETSEYQPRQQTFWKNAMNILPIKQSPQKQQRLQTEHIDQLVNQIFDNKETQNKQIRQFKQLYSQTNLIDEITEQYKKRQTSIEQVSNKKIQNFEKCLNLGNSQNHLTFGQLKHNKMQKQIQQDNTYEDQIQHLFGKKNSPIHVKDRLQCNIDDIFGNMGKDSLIDKFQSNANQKQFQILKESLQADRLQKQIIYNK